MANIRPKADAVIVGLGWCGSLMWLMTGTRGAESAKISTTIAFLREHLSQGRYALESSY